MRDPELRRRLIAERPAERNGYLRWVVSGYETVYVPVDPPNYHQSADQTIAAQARALGVATLELIYDILLSREGKEILFRPLGNATGRSSKARGRICWGVIAPCSGLATAERTTDSSVTPATQRTS